MFLHIYLITFLIYGHISLPLDDPNENLFGDMLSNSIDGDDIIDLSSLGPAAFGLPKIESGEAVSTWTESSLVNPEEMGSYAEGDILIPLGSRNGFRDVSYQWPNGIIPYQIEGRFNESQRDMIMEAIADFHRLTCLQFVPYSGQTDYIVVTDSSTGCRSTVGRIGGRQEVNLQIPACITKKGTVLHEMLHAVGFFHEQSRPERDDFVIINYNNIKKGAEGNFKKLGAIQYNNSARSYNVLYDYNSVMHYSQYAFSKNSQKTIEPQMEVSGKIGQREGLSSGDVRKVNNMYNCKKESYYIGRSVDFCRSWPDSVIRKLELDPGVVSCILCAETLWPGEPQTWWINSVRQTMLDEKTHR